MNTSKCTRLYVQGHETAGFRFVDGLRPEPEYAAALQEGEKRFGGTGKAWAVVDCDNHDIWWSDDSTFIAEVLSATADDYADPISGDWPDGYYEFIASVTNDGFPTPNETRTFNYNGNTVVAEGCDTLPLCEVIDPMTTL